MSYTVTQGDLLKAEADAIVNTVNCVGVMGKGIALQFKKKWPENFKAYKRACDAGEVRPGKVHVHELGALAGKPHFILNFPTKDHWRGFTKMDFVEEGLRDLVRVVKATGIRSIAIPPLGCGNGGLGWTEVAPRIQAAFEPLVGEVEVLVFAPAGAPRAEDLVVRTEKPRMTAGRSVLVKLLALYRELDYSLSKIEVQKLCYFAQEAGQPLNLDFGKNQFGPYSPKLRHVLNHIDGHYVRGVGDHDRAETELRLVEGAEAEADAYLSGDAASRARMEKVGRLIEGYETPFGMELLATTHWVATRQCESGDFECVIRGIHHWDDDHPAWNERKAALMTEAQIRAARGRLHEQGWLPAS